MCLKISRKSSPQNVLEDFKEIEFKMGPHKAFLFSRTLIKYDVAVFSDLDNEMLKRCHLDAADPETIVGEWVKQLGGSPRVAVVPNANTTYFHGL